MKVELNPIINIFSGNLLAKAMIDSYSQSKVFSYTFATPNNTTSSSATAGKYKGVFSIINTDDIVPQMPLKDWGFTNYGQVREISVADKYKGNKILGLGIKEGTFEWLTGHDYNNDGGTYRTLNAFSKVATNRTAIYRKDYDDLVSIKGTLSDYVANELKDKGGRLQRHIYPDRNGKKVYQTPAFLMQDLAYLASKGDYEKQYNQKYLMIPLLDGATAFIIGNNVAKLYESAKSSFIFTSGSLPLIGGMAHPHLPQTYYLIAKNNFVRLV